MSKETAKRKAVKDYFFNFIKINIEYAYFHN